ncbi:MAG: serine protease, partial [Pseudomonadota bacterium]
MFERKIAAFLFAALALAVAASPVNAQDNSSAFGQALEKLLRGSEQSNGSSGASEIRVPESQAEIQLSFAPLVRKVSQSVVNVYAARRAVPTSPFAGDPFFERFFGGRGLNRPRNQNSLGSGVIVSADGLVVTNHHV